MSPWPRYVHTRQSMASCLPSRTPTAYFWLLPCVMHLLDLPPFVPDLSFHSRMHGGPRNKHTRFRVKSPECDSLNPLCGNQHEHLPRGAQHAGKTWAFATADETVYPHILCHRLAQAVRLAMQRKEGAWPPPATLPPAALNVLPRDQLPQHDQPEHREPDLRAAADVQARRRRGPQLINEFANVVTTEVTAPPDVITARALPSKLTQKIDLAGVALPVDTRIVSNTRKLERGSDRPGVSQDSAPTRGQFVLGMQLAQNQIYVGPGPVPTCSQ